MVERLFDFEKRKRPDGALVIDVRGCRVHRPRGRCRACIPQPAPESSLGDGVGDDDAADGRGSVFWTVMVNVTSVCGAQVKHEASGDRSRLATKIPWAVVAGRRCRLTRHSRYGTTGPLFFNTTPTRFVLAPVLRPGNPRWCRRRASRVRPQKLDRRGVCVTVTAVRVTPWVVTLDAVMVMVISPGRRRRSTRAPNVQREPAAHRDEAGDGGRHARRVPRADNWTPVSPPPGRIGQVTPTSTWLKGARETPEQTTVVMSATLQEGWFTLAT